MAVVEQMILLLRSRTGVRNNDGLILDELNSAKSDIFQRVFLLDEDIEITFETELSPGAVQSYDMGANITAGEIWGVKKLWVKYSGEAEFTEAEHHDAASPEFLYRDQMTAQVMHPLFYDVVNFDQLRFAPTLPASTTIRVDWIGMPPDFSLETEAVTSMPTPLHHAVMAQAAAQLLDNRDDTRAPSWERRAREWTHTALLTISKRDFSHHIKTTPFSQRRRA